MFVLHNFGVYTMYININEEIIIKYALDVRTYIVIITDEMIHTRNISQQRNLL